MANNLYRGLSFLQYKNKKTLKLNDIELVKQDLLNHIFTRINERIMLPTFGTRIPDMPFDPMDGWLLFAIEEDLNDVIRYDPRVELRFVDELSVPLKVYPLYDEHVVIAAIDLNYIEFDTSETLNLRLEFNQ